MKFHRTLEKGQINAFKEYYIPYNDLKNDIKIDKLMFKKRLAESLRILNGFFIDLENEMILKKRFVLNKNENDQSEAEIDENLNEVHVTRKYKPDIVLEVSYQTEDENYKNVLDIDNVLYSQKNSIYHTNNTDYDTKNEYYNQYNNITTYNSYNVLEKDGFILNNSEIDDINKNYVKNEFLSKHNGNQKPFTNSFVNNENQNLIKTNKIENDNEKNENEEFDIEKNLNKNLQSRKKKGEIKSFDDADIENKNGLRKFLNQNAKKFISFVNIKKHYNERKKEKNVTNFIQDCEKIKEFARLNFTGYRKILKKYDKNYSENLSSDVLPIIKNFYFYKSNRIDKLLNEAKNFYKENFAANDKKKAKDVFHNIMRKDKSDAFSSFIAGAFTSLSLFIFCIIKIEDKALNQFYQCTNLFFYGAFLFGICMIIFKKVYINYSFIFQFDAAAKGTISKYFLLISLLSIIFNFGFFIAKDKQSDAAFLILVDV
ncbi:hypothetical protein COBT_000640 [Conglomerata obtusa]